ncbi:MAG: hypothetical protein Q8865_02010, partial [Bacillota bacterium]|nr:hypothetical protein [Bacillota bacterium]
SLFVREGVNLPSVSNAKFDKAELYIAKSKNDIKKYFNSDPAVISDFVKLNQEAHAKKDDSGTLSASFSRSGTDYVVHLYSSEFPEIYVYAGTMFYAENGAMGMLCPDLSITKFVLIPVPDNVTSDLTSLQNGTLVGKWTNSSSQQ